MKRALHAVNTHRPENVTPYIEKIEGAPGGAAQFGWVREKTTAVWQGDVLYAPVRGGGAPVPLAVFHAWHSCESDGDHVHSLQHTAQGWRLGPEIAETETLGLRVRDHEVRLTFDVPKKYARFEDRASIERTQDSIPNFGLLRLSQDYTVRLLSCNGVPIAYKQAGGVIAFVPPTAKTFTLSLRYAGTVNNRNGDYILPGEASFNSYFLPNIARLPVTTTVTVTAPPGWKPIAQGEKKTETKAADGSITAAYRNDMPVCYQTIDAAPYTVTKRVVDGRTLSTYLLVNDTKFATACLDELECSMRWYSQNFVPYPYTHYEVVQTKGQFGGALEAYSFATFGPGTLPDTIAHELAHTWWGGVVPCAYTRSMWNEGFAEYSDDLLHRRLRKVERRRNTDLPDPRPRYGNSFAGVPLAAAHDTSDGRSESVGYGKGKLVMRVLEEQIGQEKMLNCLATFAKEHPHGEAAEWGEFAAIVSRVTGEDYGWFFRQWVSRAGLPTLHLANVTAKQNGDGWTVEGDVTQSPPRYRLKLPVHLETKGTSVDAVLEVSETDGTGTHFVLRTPSAPVQITLDPDFLIPLTTDDETTFTFMP